MRFATLRIRSRSATDVPPYFCTIKLIFYLTPPIYPFLFRSHLKNVFWPDIFVGTSSQILDIQQYAFGLKLGPAVILNQNPIFEMASIINPDGHYFVSSAFIKPTASCPYAIKFILRVLSSTMLKPIAIKVDRRSSGNFSAHSTATTPSPSRIS